MKFLFTGETALKLLQQGLAAEDRKDWAEAGRLYDAAANAFPGFAGISRRYVNTISDLRARAKNMRAKCKA